MINDAPIVSFPENPIPNSVIWTPNRRELLDWLKRNAQSSAQLYEGAVYLLFNGCIPGRTRFIAHAVREIQNRLPDVVAGSQKATRLDYKSRLDYIAGIWKNYGYFTGSDLPNPSITKIKNATSSPDISIPRNIFIEVSQLINDHERTRSKPVETATRLFEALAPDNKSLRDTLTPIISHWFEVTEWFMKKTHDSGEPDNTDSSELERKFELFELCLGSLVRSFFSTVEELDEILEDTNS